MTLHAAVSLAALAPFQAIACSSCRTMVFASALDAHFLPRLLMVVSPVAVLVALGAWLWLGAGQGGLDEP